MKFRALYILFLIILNSAIIYGQNYIAGSGSASDTITKGAVIIAQEDSLGISSENVPNFFTPNGDQINDHFMVRTPEGKIYDFKVFTRTGTMIFSSRSPNVFWDGRNTNGNEVPEGIYYYVIELPEKSVEGIAGFLYLFR